MMAGPKAGPKVTWMARPLESERHAFATNRTGHSIADRSMCGLPREQDALAGADGKKKCELCRQAARRP